MPLLTWTQPALRDLRRLHDFLAFKNPAAAMRAANTIREQLNSLEKHPQIGRLIDNFPPEYRELIIEFGQGAYVARYRFNAEWVIVLAVRHGREVGY
jgi:plasmid stabilization system protein ParE